MGFTDAKAPPPPAPPGTGVSIGLQINKAGEGRVRITVREDQQHRRFGGPIAGKRVTVQIGRGSDEGRLRIALDENGAFEVRAGIKGSASIIVAAWDLLPRSPRKSEPCTIKPGSQEGEIVLELPPFCRPSAKGGRMDAEFGLKSTKSPL